MKAFGKEYHGKIPVGLEEFGWLDDYYILTGVYIIGFIELASLVLELDCLDHILFTFIL